MKYFIFGKNSNVNTKNKSYEFHIFHCKKHKNSLVCYSCLTVVIRYSNEYKKTFYTDFLFSFIA